ncbi:MAG: hypothetical protein KatS3mg114_0837 [Planctomycetaceae bacterium]|nr:MAG: hypothetical protein KatS3mg114_0837 [Planctomycetaceae bacterium]
MKGFPPVSAMCLTYGRPHLLEEAIQSFLLQDYPGPKELVVLNDFADQTLVCDHSNVRIINTGERFATVGEKRNACAELATHDILFVWDDDDLYLPWRFSLSIRRLDESKGFYKCPQAWMLNNGRVDGPTTNLYHSAGCFTRELFERAGRYPHIGSGQDWDFEDALKKLISGDKDDRTLRPEEVYYIYRWHVTGSYHLSAFGRDEGKPVSGQVKVAEFVESQVREGKIATGTVRLRPAWQSDYDAMVRSRTGITKPSPSAASEADTIVAASPIPQGNKHESNGRSLRSGNDARKAEVSVSVHPCRSRGGLPLVSCIMPTYGRPDYVGESIAMFLAQDYPAKELIVLNDCPRQKLTGDFPGVRIVNVDARWPTLGEKRNAAIELANGEYVAVWDDDDVYLPWRLSHSMRRMQELEASLYCPAEYWAYWGEGDLRENRAALEWIYHPLVIFRKDLWREVGGYPAQTLNEDTAFVRRALEQLKIDWSGDPISRSDRVMVMRGKSKYTHTSISGGQGSPDTRSGEIVLTPAPISDPVLRSFTERLIARRMHDASHRRHSRRVRESLPAAAGADEVWLDRLTPESISVGYGEAGFRGSLGYEGRPVEICGERMPHAISAHATSRISYRLGRQFETFCSRVGVNDSAPDGATSADFIVLADGEIAGIARNVRPGQLRLITADVSGVQQLELVIQTRRWNSCHTVWADPVLSGQRPRASRKVVVDSLERAEIVVPPELYPSELCIATVGSRGYADWIDDLLGSVCANAQCPNALLAIFSFDDSAEIRRVAEKYRATVIPCHPLCPLNMASKAVLYAAGHVIPARKFICLDADMLVIDDLRPIAAAIDAAPLGAILACREAHWARDLGHALSCIYGGQPDDISHLTGEVAPEEHFYRFIVNDGLFAGTRAAICSLDNQIRCLNQPARWVDDPVASRPWRNQFIFNLALAQTDCGVELNARYNIQLQSQQAELPRESVGVVAKSQGLPAGILHFNGSGRNQSSKWRGRFRSVSRPLTHSDRQSDGYEQFLAALRKWVGQLGTEVLAWSFYGTTDGRSSSIADASTFPLFGALHYLIRANGCSRVIETGTARGVSAACLASAVAHRVGGTVVTLDVETKPERDLLWSMLPAAIRECIVPRQTDAVDGLRAAIADGETFHAALLDTVHTRDHVLREFELARRLVCEGGLILIHDAIYRGGTVGAALDEIQRQGYGVTRLWTAEDGEREDDALGLAVIENRRRL